CLQDAVDVLNSLVDRVVNGDDQRGPGPEVSAAPTAAVASCEPQPVSRVSLVPYREQDDSDLSSSSSSSEDEAPRRAASSDDSDDAEPRPSAKRKGPPGRPQGRARTTGLKTPGELDIDDLPPIEELRISVPQAELRQAGTVHSTVDQLLVVESCPGQPVLDLDSVLFVADGASLGQVFDVFGPVSRPFYVVRFNSAQDLAERGLAHGAAVFYAPLHADVTLYVLESEVRKLRGSDASWENNNEPPPECLDFSDDEQERQVRRKLKGGHDHGTKTRGPRQPAAVGARRPQPGPPARFARPPQERPLFSGAPTWPPFPPPPRWSQAGWGTTHPNIWGTPPPPPPPTPPPMGTPGMCWAPWGRMDVPPPDLRSPPPRFGGPPDPGAAAAQRTQMYDPVPDLHRILTTPPPPLR
ncbi:unnamed protein product, partial [Ixodes hexagonus]